MPIWAFVGVISLVLGGVTWVQTARLGVAQDRLELCTAAHQKTLDLVKKQNQAVKDLENEAQEARRIAKAALAEAQRSAPASRKEKARLEAELGKKPVTDCAAGEAVKRVREGL